jgi:hypothetical protein
MSVEELQWKEGQAAPAELSPEEQEAVRQRIKALDELLKTTKHAKYKIELFFGKARSLNHPTPGIMSFWESGSKLHGGGDAKVYICPGKFFKVSQCESVIPEAAVMSGLHFCSTCKRTWKSKQVIGEQLANLTMRDWAKVILHYFIILEHNADIYLKHSHDDIRTVAMQEQAKSRGGEALAKVRGRRAVHIYPLNRIVKDTSAGADVLGRFVAFLTA